MNIRFVLRSLATEGEKGREREGGGGVGGWEEGESVDVFLF